MSNRTDFPTVAEELGRFFGLRPTVVDRFATELHDAYVAGQEECARQRHRGDKRPRKTAEAIALARIARGNMEREVRESLRLTAAADGLPDHHRAQAQFLIGEMDAAERLRAQVAEVEGQRDHLQSKLATLGHQLMELSEEPAAETCDNAECPIGCPDSHAVDYGAAEDAAEARRRIESLQRVRGLAQRLATAINGAAMTVKAEDLAARFNSDVLPIYAELAEALG